MRTWRYDIEGTVLEVLGTMESSPLDAIPGFGPFRTGEAPPPVMRFNLSGGPSYPSWVTQGMKKDEDLYHLLFTEDHIFCRLLRAPEGYIFVMENEQGRNVFYTGSWPSNNSCLEIISDWEFFRNPKMLRFSLWIALGLAIAPRHQILIHSSVLVYRGRAVLFLGESGTGKSTHTRLWRENVSGAGLLNDDSPILKSCGSAITVTGSPWSGKTPCFKKESYPVAAIIRLSQAPYNRITRLHSVQALGALYPSCPPAFAQDRDLCDGICNTLSEVITRIPVYHMECLPDADAVLTVKKELFSKQ